MDKKMSLVERVLAMVLQEWNEEIAKTLEVSVMGQAGVGKTSLMNALFDTHFEVDPIRPATKDIQIYSEKTSTGHEILFNDLPGVGESVLEDKRRIDQYKEKMESSQVVIWAIQADSRSYVFDSEILQKILAMVATKEKQIELLSKIVFVLTKVDHLMSDQQPSPWILSKETDKGVFKPQKLTRELIAQKEEYFRSAFITQFGELIRGKTYCNSNFTIKNHPKIRRTGRRIYYEGLLTKAERDFLKQSYPQYAQVFDRLYDSYRIIPCSARFRYNLNFLMRVIVDRLQSESVGPFGDFIKLDVMSHMPLLQAKQLRNIVLLDEKRGFSLDIANVDF
ncbi:MAG TPA: GTPase [Ktedonobacteraceae bacterium]|nr:GTPase [Ktedonobacteraceae bacterium]